ncbi:MAG: Alpha-(1,3)-fucosyltransferase FucT [candidate division WS2 bacterium]|nr:Alpha-(1,3)-fucosyltransferase FucT [Candidatus Psychracetigena formicireducens]
MAKATLFTSSFYLNNTQFDISDKIRDNCLYMFYLLKKRFEENGIDLSTQDINSPLESQFIIYNEMPKIKNIMPDKNNYLLIFESKIIKPDNWDAKNHKYFKKIFTWDDNLVDGKKYLKINYAHKIPTDIDYDMNKKEKLCTMIVAHKFKSHPLELYTERVKAIRWFEQNHPEDFDLYGIGWDKYCFKGALSMLNRFGLLTKPLKPKYPSYKGTVKSKRDVLQKYKFAICYENARDIPGYITEKIFDCLFAGCVPVYWGAPNVTEHIPAGTFIDKRNLNTYKELYSYLRNMPDKEYMGYLDAIKDFIQSDKIYPFSAECFADTLINEILGGHVR